MFDNQHKLTKIMMNKYRLTFLLLLVFGFAQAQYPWPSISQDLNDVQWAGGQLPTVGDSGTALHWMDTSQTWWNIGDSLRIMGWHSDFNAIGYWSFKDGGPNNGSTRNFIAVGDSGCIFSIADGVLDTMQYSNTSINFTACDCDGFILARKKVFAA